MKLKKAIQNLCLLDDKNLDSGYVFAEDYILILSSSSSHEIKEMIIYVLENYYMECPFWAKTIAFRILINKNPNDKEIIEWAIADALMFGDPEWGKIIKGW